MEQLDFTELRSRLEVIPDGELVALLLDATDRLRAAAPRHGQRRRRDEIALALLQQRVCLSNLLYRLAPAAFARGLLIHEGSEPFVMPPEIPDTLPIGWSG
jgi:hypothetical protein